jgi:hypothetical protein
MAVLANVSPVAGQGSDLSAIVDSFYPADLIASALQVGERPVRRQCFAVLESDSSGRPRVVAAAYTNLTIGAIRVLTSDGSGFRVAAEPRGEDLAGWTCEVRRVDVDLDGRYEAHVKFAANNGSSDWLFAWDGQQLVNLTPVVTNPLDGVAETTLRNAELFDTDGDRIPEVYTYSIHRGGEPPFPPAIYRLGNGRYVEDRRVVVAYEFVRSDETLTTESVRVMVPAGARGPFRVRVFNGTGTGTRVENAVESGRVWLNGRELVGPNDFGNHVSLIERSVSLEAENELEVRLAGAPGGRITVVIDAASWTN